MANKSILAFQLAFVCNAVLIVFAVAVFTSFLPLELLNPNWQLRFIQTFLDNGVNPLIALGLCYLASYLDPLNVQLSAHAKRLSNWCILAVVGFILLIPLQVATSYSLYSADRQQQIGKYNAAIKNIRLFETAISTSKDYGQLSRALGYFQGVRLPADIQKPRDFAKIKYNILQQAKLAKKLVSSKRRPEQLYSSLILNIQIASRNILLAFVYSLGFSSLAKRGDKEATVFQEVVSWMIDGMEHRLRQRELSLASSQVDPKELLSDQVNSPAKIQRLHSDGIIDSGWIQDQSDCPANSDVPFNEPAEPSEQSPLKKLLAFSRRFDLRPSQPQDRAYFDALSETFLDDDLHSNTDPQSDPSIDNPADIQK